MQDGPPFADPEDQTTVTTRAPSHSRETPTNPPSNPPSTRPASPPTTPDRETARTGAAHGWSPRRALDAGMRRATDECIALLEQGRALIDALEDEDYAVAPGATASADANVDTAAADTTTDDAAGAWSSPGAHTRHLLEFVGCLLSGLDARRVDYTARKRCAELETSRHAARREITEAIEGLERLRALRGDHVLDVRPEPEQAWTRSTLAREVQFVSSHAVHHHALIRMTLSHRGVEPPPEYGVAPSTLASRNRPPSQSDRDDA